MEVSNGLKRLYSLRLDKTPAADRIAATTEEWAKSMHRKLGIAVEQVDSPRIVAGFDWLVDNCKSWPSPAMLYERMPRRPERQRLENRPNVEDCENGKQKIREIMRGLI